MSCTLLFCLANLYVNVEVTKPTHHEYEGYWCEMRWCRGPRTEVKLGMRVPLNEAWMLDYGFSHASFILEPHDKGQNMPFIKIEWRPFQ